MRNPPPNRNAFDFYWPSPEAGYDPAQAKKLLAEAAHPNGFDGGEYYGDSSYSNLGEAVLNNLDEVGIQLKLRPIERGAFGNAATRLAAFIVKGGPYVYGSYPDLDDLLQKQAIELDHGKRETILHKIQQQIHERTVAAPIWQPAFINGFGRRVGEPGFGLIPTFAYTGLLGDITLKGTWPGHSRRRAALTAAKTCARALARLRARARRKGRWGRRIHALTSPPRRIHA